MEPFGLGKLLLRRRPIIKKVTLSRLIDILHNVGQLSIVTRSERSSSWDFDKSIPFLEKNDLHKHITFVDRRTSKHLPPNSERHLYDITNIIIRHLRIELDDRSGWTAHDDWEPLSYAMWHFEDCYFEASSSSMWPINFPWSGSFRFYRNKFDFPTNRYGAYWIIVFRGGSRILFQGNDFTGNSIQTRCVSSVVKQNAEGNTGSEMHASSGISFVGNRRIDDLQFQEGYSFVALTGMNRVERIWLDQVENAEHRQETTIYFGPREKIDRDFHHCLQHRKLFLSLRDLAAANHDERQLAVLDKQIDRIEYFLNKEQDAPFALDYRVWVEYWQDRLLYAWRRWSSDFYKSWTRPLAMIILGYMLINAIPVLFIEDFSLSHWIEFTLRPIGEIAGYEAALSRIIGGDYDTVSSSEKNVLRLFGLIEVIWIAMWSFAFAKAIRR